MQIIYLPLYILS